VDAYAAIFETPAPVHDQDGDYIEVIDPAAFNRILPKLAPQGERTRWRCGVFYNHGMTIHGTPSEQASMPIGIPLEIKADQRGLFTRTRYHRGDLADQVLEAIREGSLAGYSFSGRFDRSHPARPRGGWHPDSRGSLPVVRRAESTLREYGPTPFPVYAGADITAVRADLVTAQLDQVTEALRSGTPLEDLPFSLPDDPAAPEQRGSVPGDSPPAGRSGRSLKQEMQAQRSAFLQRYRR
jgi:HK97 family phage prohead protease